MVGGGGQFEFAHWVPVVVFEEGTPEKGCRLAVKVSDGK